MLRRMHLRQYMYMCNMHKHANGLLWNLSLGHLPLTGILYIDAQAIACTIYNESTCTVINIIFAFTLNLLDCDGVVTRGTGDAVVAGRSPVRVYVCMYVQKGD
jgi:hypothetical protein